MQNKLIRLLASNRQRGDSRVRAEIDGESATLYLYDAVVATEAEAQWFGGVAADTFVRQVLALDAKTIRLRINSPGGDVFAARAMAQALREHPARVEVIVDGYAASAASVVAMAGDHVAMADGAFVMIHNAWTIAMGNASDLTDTAALLTKIDQSIAETYAKRAGSTAEEMLQLMAAETWLSADEAIALGLADEALTDAPQDRARWDLSAYSGAPNQQAEKQDKGLEPKAIDAARESREQRDRRLKFFERVGA
jgi:ATP-dependent Clp protease protease subunit